MKYINIKPYRTLLSISGFLGFSKNFTNLHKVIANTLNILMRLKIIGITFLFIAITLLNSASTPFSRDFTVKTVIIDAGHGGHDSGTSGKKYKEKDIALKIALKVGHYIKENVPGVTVIYTRDKDEYIALDERAAIANKNHADTRRPYLWFTA
jgi:N-acetylmuramoyl-L-alanine amidase